MELLLENHNEVTTMTNGFEAKAELASLLENIQGNEGSVSPLEAAALELTMRQLDPTMNIPAQESLRNGSDFFVSLARENLQDDLKGKWAKFVKTIKEYLRRMVEGSKKMVSDLKARFNRGPNSPLKVGERVTEKEEPTSSEVPPEEKAPAQDNVPTKTTPPPTPEVKTYERIVAYNLPMAYFASGQDTSPEGYLHCIETLGELVNFGKEVDSVANIKQIFKNAETMEDDAWEAFLKDLQAKLNATCEGGKELRTDMRCAPGEGLSYPRITISQNMGTLDVKDCDINYFGQLDAKLKQAIKVAESSIPSVDYDFSAIRDERLGNRHYKLGEFYLSRSYFFNSINAYLGTTIDVGEAVLGDFRAMLKQVQK